MPFRRHGRVQIAQSPGRCIAGVFQGIRVGLVILFQGRQAHDAFALHLQHALVGNGKRDLPDGFALRQNALAHFAVAAGGRLRKHAVPVRQIDGQSVKLILHAILGRWHAVFPGQLFAAVQPEGKFIFVLALVHAPQPGDMGMFLKPGQHIAAHAVGRRIRKHSSRFLFQGQQFVIHAVPFRVGDQRFIQRIVSTGRFVQTVHQSAHFFHTHTGKPSLPMHKTGSRRAHFMQN